MLPENAKPIDLQVMDTIEPVGYIARKHKDGILVVDGGRIISESFLVSDDVSGNNLYTEHQMREAIEKTIILLSK